MRAVLLLLSLAALGVQAQKLQAQQFEVASIRRCDPKSLHAGVSGSPGVVIVPCVTVKNLIDWTYAAYANGPHFNAQLTIPVEGAPAWIDTDRFTINAKAPGKMEILTMFSGPPMRALLEDRFKLKFHRETREVPVYLLMAGEGSLKLEKAQLGDCEDWEDPWDHPVTPPVPFLKRRPLCRTLQAADHGLEVDGATMKELSALFLLDRPVIDKTGLAGPYDIHLDLFFSDLGIPGDAAPDTAPSHPPLKSPADRFDAVRTALRKIGLDLEAAQGPREVLVIDRLERPGEN